MLKKTKQKNKNIKPKKKKKKSKDKTNNPPPQKKTKQKNWTKTLAVQEKVFSKHLPNKGQDSSSDSVFPSPEQQVEGVLVFRVPARLLLRCQNFQLLHGAAVLRATVRLSDLIDHFLGCFRLSFRRQPADTLWTQTVEKKKEMCISFTLWREQSPQY